MKDERKREREESDFWLWEEMAGRVLVSRQILVDLFNKTFRLYRKVKMEMLGCDKILNFDMCSTIGF